MPSATAATGYQHDARHDDQLQRLAACAELVLATGAIDLWVADLQDVYPGIMEVAACFYTKVVTTNDSARLPGAIAMGFDHRHGKLGEVRAMAREIIGLTTEFACMGTRRVHRSSLRSADHDCRLHTRLPDPRNASGF